MDGWMEGGRDGGYPKSQLLLIIPRRYKNRED